MLQFYSRPAVPVIFAAITTIFPKESTTLSYYWTIILVCSHIVEIERVCYTHIGRFSIKPAGSCLSLSSSWSGLILLISSALFSFLRSTSDFTVCTDVFTGGRRRSLLTHHYSHLESRPHTPLPCWHILSTPEASSQSHVKTLSIQLEVQPASERCTSTKTQSSWSLQDLTKEAHPPKGYRDGKYRFFHCAGEKGFLQRQPGNRNALRLSDDSKCQKTAECNRDFSTVILQQLFDTKQNI